MVSSDCGETQSRFRSTSPEVTRASLRDWVDGALALLFAPECAVCARPLAQPTEGAVCTACWQSIRLLTPPSCRCCADPLPDVRAVSASICQRCAARDPAVDEARAMGVYEGALKAIVHALKYDGRRSLASRLARLMRARHGDLLARAVAAVPVPLHASRRRERGFNQAEDLARHLGLPVVRALRRSRRTSIQAELASARRAANVRGAFTTTRRAAGLIGCSVVVVDDVSTTGATLEACATALKAAGIARVYAITAARVVTRPL